MPRPQATAEQKRAARRGILQAAASLYEERGLQDISARAVAQRAGVSVGTLYTHFASVAEIMQLLWQKPVAAASARLEAIAADTPDPLLRVRALLEAYADFALSEPVVYRGAFLFLRSDPLPEEERTALDETALYRLLREAIVDAQAAGCIASGAEAGQLAETLWAALHGALALPLNLDRVRLSPAREQIGPMIDLLLAGLER